MIGLHKVLAVIPARGGSKGVPRKNILPILGEPLIRWTIDAARGSRYIDRLILSSDDEEIMNVALACGCEVPFRRSPLLASDTTSSVDVVLDAIIKVPNYDIVILLQPTSPLRKSADIDGALEMLIESRALACVSVCSAVEHPFWTFRANEHGRLAHYVDHPNGLPMRRQDLPDAFRLNGAIYIAHKHSLVQDRTFLTSHTVGFTMPADRSLDVDTHEDVERLISILQSA